MYILLKEVKVVFQVDKPNNDLPRKRIPKKFGKLTEGEVLSSIEDWSQKRLSHIERINLRECYKRVLQESAKEDYKNWFNSLPRGVLDLINGKEVEGSIIINNKNSPNMDYALLFGHHKVRCPENIFNMFDCVGEYKRVA